MLIRTTLKVPGFEFFSGHTWILWPKNSHIYLFLWPKSPSFPSQEGIWAFFGFFTKSLINARAALNVSLYHARAALIVSLLLVRAAVAISPMVVRSTIQCLSSMSIQTLFCQFVFHFGAGWNRTVSESCSVSTILWKSGFLPSLLQISEGLGAASITLWAHISWLY